MSHRLSFAGLATVVAVAHCGLATVHANLTIIPTFEGSITSNPNATYFESQINSAISAIDGYIANPITVSIDFQAVTFGLGSNVAAGSPLSYSQYLSDLQTRQSLSAADQSALASLPAGPNDPVPGNTSQSVNVTSALLRALGEPKGNIGGFDGTIFVNLSLLMLPTNTTAKNAGLYSTQTVVAHEMDEILGIGGDGSDLNYASQYPNGLALDPVGPMDLFRYSGDGVRSYSTSSSVTSYFSIDGGKTDLVRFNQASSGDYGDWYATTQVQNAFGVPGKVIYLGRNELTALDAVGWNLTPTGTALETGTPIPETSTLAMLVGTLGLVLLPRKRRVLTCGAADSGQDYRTELSGGG